MLDSSPIVSHRERRIVVVGRGDEGRWRRTVAVAGGRVPVPSLGFELAVDAIYRNSRIA